MTIGRYQRTNWPVPIIGKTIIGRYRSSADYRCISRYNFFMPSHLTMSAKALYFKRLSHLFVRSDTVTTISREWLAQFDTTDR